MLAELLGVSASAQSFAEQLGLAVEPPVVRVRFGDGIGMPPGLSDLGIRRDELELLDIKVHSALIIENRTTLLSVPIPNRGIVIWGQGFDVTKAGSLPWLADSGFQYWGDIDTHGFAILHRLRSTLPRVSSVLMDRATFVEHRDRWTSETAPTRARNPSRPCYLSPRDVRSFVRHIPVSTRASRHSASTGAQARTRGSRRSDLQRRGAAG